MVNRLLLSNKKNFRANKRAMTSIDLIITLIIAFVTLFIVIAFIKGFFSKITFPSVVEKPTADNPMTFSFRNTLTVVKGKVAGISIEVYNNGDRPLNENDKPIITCNGFSSSPTLNTVSSGYNVSIGSVSGKYEVQIDTSNLDKGDYSCLAKIASIQGQFKLHVK